MAVVVYSAIAVLAIGGIFSVAQIVLRWIYREGEPPPQTFPRGAPTPAPDPAAARGAGAHPRG